MSEPEYASGAPVMEVVAGSPTPEEIAAVLAVVIATAAPGDPSAPSNRTDLPRAGGWKSYWRTVRSAHRPGPGGWRAL